MLSPLTLVWVKMLSSSLTSLLLAQSPTLATVSIVMTTYIF